MRVGIKYCGGCDPNYERRTIVQRARRDWPEALFEPYDPAAEYDLVLVVCGCLEECFSFSCENSRRGAVWVRSPEEYERVRERMDQ